jgi:hypothetical protein
MFNKQLLVGLSVLASYLVFPKEAVAQLSGVEEDIFRLHETKFRWMTEKKLDSLAWVLDDSLVYIHSNGWTQTKKELLDDLQSGKLVMKQVDIIDSKLRSYPNHTAIITAKADIHTVTDGKEVMIRLLYTEVYLKKKKSWLLVTRHACLI